MNEIDWHNFVDELEFFIEEYKKEHGDISVEFTEFLKYLKVTFRFQ